MSDSTRFRFSIDRGGTFTDVYAELSGGRGFRVEKLLSNDPDNYADAPSEGIRRIIKAETGDDPLMSSRGTDRIEWIRMGTTVATNALLERAGVPTVLVTTKGFGDLLRIGNQTRPDIFDLRIRKPDLIYQAVVEVDERVRPLDDGEETGGKTIKTGTTGEDFAILKAPDKDRITGQLQAVFDQGIRSVAVVFAHAYAFTAHEALVGDIAESIGFPDVSLSHRVMPRVKMVARGDTTTVDAYLTPHIRDYLKSFKRGFADGLKHTPVLFMQSDGGLVPDNRFGGSNAILSGPAGGVVGYAMTTRRMLGDETVPVIGFDMGGTSTDVSRYCGGYERVHETETAGVRIQAPQMEIKTVAAGGGSRLFFRNFMFETGPESAGAHPGPICYRKGGYLAVTDANLFLGRIQPDYFPSIFGKTGDQPLDSELAAREFRLLTDEINRAFGRTGANGLSCEEVALGFLRVANETMIRPVREISVMRGYDVKDHVLACFGGAGGQHACAVARELGITKICIHRFSGILSAYGMGLADRVVEKQAPSARVYTELSHGPLMAGLSGLAEDAVDELLAEGCPAGSIRVDRYLNLRYEGTDTAVMMPVNEKDDLAGKLSAYYLREFGFDLGGRKIMVDDLRVRVVSATGEITPWKVDKGRRAPVPDAVKECYFEGGWAPTPVYLLDDLGAGDEIAGPAIIMQQTSTILVEPGCRASATPEGDVIIDVPMKKRANVSEEVDPIMLSVFSSLFMSVAEQMGRTLQKTAISTNIKERLDFSCALFDRNGDLVANAPHVPVHLGSMGEAVKCQKAIHGENLVPGDVFVTNHPLEGGSHLPDITVISPVFKDGELLFFVASRGHHADIGGISPGSMPPFSKKLQEEGACIRSYKLVEKGVFNEKGISSILSKFVEGEDGAVIPGTRRLSDNISDLKAQVAANKKGIELLLEMVDIWSEPVVFAYMGHVRQAAENSVRDMLKDVSERLGLGETGDVYAEDLLDDGSVIKLTLTINRREGSAIFDFSGTAKERPGNLNAPYSVTRSAILYALRCLVDKDIPLNQGCLNPIDIILEEGSLLRPSENAAVAGGNVLTSQRITDVVLKAFRAAAASQGCMNNLTFGDDTFGYYETIGGGAGAGPDWNGRSGVHTHMTNTRITDPEILERRFPVMLREFALRKESGGKGRFSGGHGLVRELEFLKPMNVAILSERRVFPPYGLEGGEPGKTGKNVFILKSGERIDLGGKNERHAESGDRIRILTPGGGGFGRATP